MTVDVLNHVCPIYAVKVVYFDVHAPPFGLALLHATVNTSVLIPLQRRGSFPGSQPQPTQRGSNLAARRRRFLSGFHPLCL